MRQFLLSLIFLSVIIFLHSCSSIPKGVQAVTPFNVNKYLGKWYEIARLDFKYEKNMIYTSAEYSLLEDGKIKVVNKGYDTVKHQQKEAVGKAKFVSDKNVAMLKVSFFGPFYAGYNVIDLDENYKYALVAGRNLNYLWILSREKIIPDNIKESFLKKASGIGYNINNLIWVKQLGN